MILGVASEWTERKGLRDFIELDEMLISYNFEKKSRRELRKLTYRTLYLEVQI